MAADYASTKELQRIWDVAQSFKGSRLPRVLVMTDPRAPDPDLRLWPGPVALIYRHFGAEDRLKQAQVWRQHTFAGGHHLLIGDDTDLAIQVGADGVHFRRDAALAAPALWRRRCPGWLISMAGIKEGTYSGDLSVLDGLLVSSVFKSRSPSAGTPIGAEGLRQQTQLDAPLFALGGIHADTINQLSDLPIAGVAGVSFRRAIMDALKIEKQVNGKDIRLVATHADFPGLEAELDLKFSGEGQYSATHTGVPREMEGKGVGSRLFIAMVEDARANGYKVIPVCPFIVVKYKRKPDTQDTMLKR
jgi:thiamine-phosphate pyrophosphorylase